MPLATYLALCIDAQDAQHTAGFWGAVLGLEVGEDRGAIVRLDGPRPQDRVWVNQVPEPAPAHNRLHLGVHTGSVAELPRLGAAVRDDSHPWTVLTDLDGGDFCALVRAEPPPQRLYELGLDARDPQALATWWAELIGGRAEAADGGAWAIGEIPGAPFDRWCVSPTTEPKTVKNRVHVDVTTEDVDRLAAHGARLLRAPGDDTDWHVLADPEGNELCAFVR